MNLCYLDMIDDLGKMRFEKDVFFFFNLIFKVEFTLFSLIMNFLSF